MTSLETAPPVGPYDSSPRQQTEHRTLALDASLWRRFSNFLIDTVVALLLTFLVSLILHALFSYDHFSVFEEVSIYLVFVVVRFFYYAGMESYSGKTLGKFITQTQVIGERGEKPTFKRTAMRTLYRLIPFEFVSILFSAKKRCWHDVLSETRVVTLHN